MSDPAEFFKNHFTAQNPAKRVGTAAQLQPITGDEAGQHHQLGQKLGVPARVVEANPTRFQQQAATNEATSLLEAAPVTAAWLNDPARLRLAHDDLRNATWWERNSALFEQGQARAIHSGQQWGRDAAAALETTLLGRSLTRLQQGAEESLMMDEEGNLNWLGRLAELARGEDGPRVGAGTTPEQKRDAILAEPLHPIAQAAADELARFEEMGLQPMTYDEIGSFGEAVQFMSENLFASAPHMMATIASGGFSPMISGHLMAAEANQELVDMVPDLPLDERAKLAGAAGTAMAGLELFGLSRILGPISPGQLAGEAIEGTLLDRLTKEGVSAAAARTLQAGLAEGSTELLQEGIIMSVTSYAGGEYTAAEVRHRLTNAFAAGGSVGMGMRGGVETTNATSQLLQDATRWAFSGQTAQDVEQISQMAQDSQLRARAPDQFQEMLEAQGYDGKTIMVPAGEVNTFFQDQVSDDDLAALGVDRGDYEASLATGGDIAVPLSNYATHFAGTELDTVFQDHGRIDTQEMSRAEMTALEEGVGAEMAQAIETDLAAAAEPAIDVQAALTEQLVAAGRSQNTAATEALVHSSFFETMAERTGANAADLAGRYGLEVRGMSDIPQGGATATGEGAAAGPAAQIVASPQPDVLLQEGARDVEIEVQMDDGTMEVMNAGQVQDALEQRQEDARSLLECLNYG